METTALRQIERIGEACEHYGVKRLRIFGSALTDRFDPRTSDIDFLVTFKPDRANLYDDFFGLKLALEQIVHTQVDLIMERSIKNPFFKASAFAEAKEIYAA